MAEKVNSECGRWSSECLKIVIFFAIACRSHKSIKIVDGEEVVEEDYLQTHT